MGSKDVRAGGAYVEAYTKDNTDKGLNSIKAKLGAFAGGVAKIGGLAVTAATTAVAASVMKAISNGADIKDIANRYQLGTTAIQALSYAAKQSGTDLDAVAIGIKNMQKGLGNGTLGDELTSIGLSAEKLKGVAPEKQFAMIAEAMGRVSDPSKRTALALAFFGKSADQLLPLLRSDAEGVKALMDQFSLLGITMSEKAVKEAAELDDRIETLTARFTALAVEIGTALLPTVNDLIDLIERAKGDGGPVSIMDHDQGGGKRFARIGGTPKTPLGEFIDQLGPQLEAMKRGIKDRERTRGVEGGLDAIRSVLRENGIGRNDYAARNLAKMPGNALNGIYDYLAGSPMGRGDQASAGTFDKRDVAAGTYLQATQSQLAELKKLNGTMDEIKRKKPGIPWG